MTLVNDIFLSPRNLAEELPWLEQLGVAPSATSDPIDLDRSSVVVVGNGGFPAPHGQEIDAFPTVVRFNAFKTEGFEGLVGTKTTIHVLNSQNLGQAGDTRLGQIHLLIDTSTPAKMYEFYFANVHRLAGLQIIRPSLYQHLGCLLNRRYKTQGFFFIELARFYFDLVAIAGFSGHTHYFNSRWSMYTAHPLEAEHAKYVEWESATFRILA